MIRMTLVNHTTISAISNEIQNHQQGWPWARAKWATALDFTSKLGLIPKNLKALIEKPQYIYIYKN
jgi:hypothetical protein